MYDLIDCYFDFSWVFLISIVYDLCYN